MMMKKTFLLTFATLTAGSLLAADLTVTVPAGDSSVEGSFANVLSNAASGDVIGFEFDGEQIEPFTAVAIEGKTLTINGINRKNNKKVVFAGGAKSLDLKGGVTTINDCVFSGKTNQAIFIQNSGVLNVTRCEFYNNKTGDTGGCIGVSTLCTVNILNSVFDGNKGANGGCLRVYNQATVNIENSTFLNNVAAQSGGCIYVYTTKGTDAKANITLTNSTFVRNQASARGGVLYAYSRYEDAAQPMTTKIANCTFTGNYSGANIGGAICLFSNSNCASKLIMVNSILAGNAGGLVDGAFFVPQDLCIYDGNADDQGNVYPRGYHWDLKNNLIGVMEKTADDKQINNIALKAHDKTNIDVTDFAKANIYGAIYRLDNSFNEDMEDEDIMYAPELTVAADLPVAMISSTSIAKGAGIATYANITIPATDQLGNARPASPAIGAVEFGDLSGIAGVSGTATANVWAEAGRLYTDATEGIAVVYNTAGQPVAKVAVDALSAVSFDAYRGSVLIVKVIANGTLTSKAVVIR